MNWKEYKDQVNMDKVIKAIESIIELEGLKSSNRQHDLVHQRYYLIYYLKSNSRISLVKIGEMFERDHSTVIHALKQHEIYTSLKDKVYEENIYHVREYLKIEFPQFIS